MPSRYRPECLESLEPVLGQPPLVVGQVFDCQAEVVGVFHEGEQFFRLLK